MPKKVQIKRGPLTWQWQTVPSAWMKPPPMKRDGYDGDHAHRGLEPQVATLHGVPDHLDFGSIMQALDGACWIPGSEKFTELHWSVTENGRVQFLDAQGQRVAI